MKTRDILKLIRDDGWSFVRQTGSHAHFKHPAKPGIVTIPMHGMNDDLKKGTENSILKQAGLK